MKVLRFCLLSMLCAGGVVLAGDPTLKEKEALEQIERLAKDPDGSLFVPPLGWMVADPARLSRHVRFMVLGQGSGLYPPTINLATEPFNGTLQDYLKIVKDINKSKGSRWKSLGNIQTKSGPASLSQAEATTQWGDVRMLHLITLHNGTVHIVTATAMKDEFPSYYPQFFKALQSFRFNDRIAEEEPEPAQQQS